MPQINDIKILGQSLSGEPSAINKFYVWVVNPIDPKEISMEFDSTIFNYMLLIDWLIFSCKITLWWAMKDLTEYKYQHWPIRNMSSEVIQYIKAGTKFSIFCRFPSAFSCEKICTY